MAAPPAFLLTPYHRASVALMIGRKQDAEAALAEAAPSGTCSRILSILRWLRTRGAGVLETLTREQKQVVTLLYERPLLLDPEDEKALREALAH